METIVTLKITLNGTKPPIWRRVEVPASHTLGELHKVLNGAMGWLDYHLHEFDIDGRLYGQPDADFDDGFEKTLPEDKARLSSVVRAGIKRFGYRYDFGDDWRHTVAIEKTSPAAAGVFYPRCTGGRRAPAPEDCGGPWGLAEFIEAMADPTHPDHDELKAWYGDEYDPAVFSIDEVSTLLRMIATGEFPETW